MLPLLALLAASVTPDSLYRQATHNPALERNGYGEQFCWNGAFYIKSFLNAWKAWGDTAWLDAGVRYYDYLLSKMQTGPDGYRGWIGPYIYDNSVWCDVHVGDAILLDGIVSFSEVVLKDDALRKKYGEPARRYVALARRELFEKWDARGTWQENGPYGAYRSWNRYGDTGSLTGWTVRNEVKGSNLTLPLNKLDHVAAVAMKLYRITGEEQFRRRAEKIFAWHKSRLQLVEDHYSWNYWEPFGAWDRDPATGKTRHWVGVHPDRAYQSGEVAHIVEAYHTGIVFDRQDIQRILNTALKVMWNGDRENPRYRNSNGKEQKAGALWPSLEDFDQTVRDLHAVHLARGNGALNEIARALFQANTKTPPGFTRKCVR